MTHFLFGLFKTVSQDRPICWKDLANAFLSRYSFSIEITYDRFDLKCMEKKNSETFHEYA